MSARSKVPFTLLRRIFGPKPNIRWLIAGILSVSLICALIARLLAPENFPSYGWACWWAVQTVTTVGYGDVVPTTGPGKFLAAVLMIVAVAFVSVLTAAISASFVRNAQERRGRGDRQEVLAILEDHRKVLAVLERIDQRLAELERRS